MLSRKILTWWCAFRRLEQNRSAAPPSIELRDPAAAAHREHAGEAEDDRNERDRTPPVFPESGQAVGALTPGPKDAKERDDCAQHLANALHD
jgi:hypothetical protein